MLVTPITDNVYSLAVMTRPTFVRKLKISLPYMLIKIAYTFYAVSLITLLLAASYDKNYFISTVIWCLVVVILCLNGCLFTQRFLLRALRNDFRWSDSLFNILLTSLMLILSNVGFYVSFNSELQRMKLDFIAFKIWEHSGDGISLLVGVTDLLWIIASVCVLLSMAAGIVAGFLLKEERLDNDLQTLMWGRAICVEGTDYPVHGTEGIPGDFARIKRNLKRTKANLKVIEKD